MKATESQRRTARQFLQSIKKETQGFEPGIKDGVLDDWNDEGSFQIALVLKSEGRRPHQIETNLRRLTPAIKRAAEKTERVVLSEINHPASVTEWNSAAGRSETAGHANTTTMVHFFAFSSRP